MTPNQKSLIIELDDIRNDFLIENNINILDIVIIENEVSKGNTKAISNQQWCINVQKKYLRCKENILTDIDNIFVDFTELGSLPYQINNLLKDDNQIESIDHILIVEFLYDAVGSDSHKEWLVLYNPTLFNVDLNGWKIQVAGKYFSDTAILSGVLESKKYFRIAGEIIDCTPDMTVNLFLQNGGVATDGVRLVDNNGNVVDTVLYDSNNTNHLSSDNHEIGISFAPDVKNGYSLRRKNIEGNYQDNNLSAQDFEVNQLPNINLY